MIRRPPFPPGYGGRCRVRRQGGGPPLPQRIRASENLILDRCLEGFLLRKPGALPGSTALAQARASGTLGAAHEAFAPADQGRHCQWSAVSFRRDRRQRRSLFITMTGPLSCTSMSPLRPGLSTMARYKERVAVFGAQYLIVTDAVLFPQPFGHSTVSDTVGRRPATGAGLDSRPNTTGGDVPDAGSDHCRRALQDIGTGLSTPCARSDVGIR